MGTTSLLQKTNTKIQNDKLLLLPSKKQKKASPLLLSRVIFPKIQNMQLRKSRIELLSRILCHRFFSAPPSKEHFFEHTKKIQKSFLLPVFIVATPSKEPLRGFRRNVHSSHSSAFLFLNPDHILSSDDEWKE